MNETERAIRELQLYVDVRWGGFSDVFNPALDALREKAEREKGCFWCLDVSLNDVRINEVRVNINCCPMCGRRLEVEQDA